MGLMHRVLGSGTRLEAQRARLPGVGALAESVSSMITRLIWIPLVVVLFFVFGGIFVLMLSYVFMMGRLGSRRGR